MKHASSRAPDLLHGPVFSNMTRFFLPIMLGSLLQQLYSMVDAVVLGRLVGKTALAAVGGSDLAIINLVVGFFVGLASGACVVVSQHYGAGEDGAVRRAVHTAILFSVVIGAVMTALGIGLARPILVLLDPPADTLEDSIVYLQWYFAGMIPSMVYNMGAGILRAVGDSKRPLYFLIVCALANTVLDLLFVAGFRLGTAGAAIATSLSQLICAGLVVWTLARIPGACRLQLSELRFDRALLGRITAIGLPAGLASVMYSAANVIIQKAINLLGTDGRLVDLLEAGRDLLAGLKRHRHHRHDLHWAELRRAPAGAHPEDHPHRSWHAPGLFRAVQPDAVSHAVSDRAVLHRRSSRHRRGRDDHLHAGVFLPGLLLRGGLLLRHARLRQQRHADGPDPFRHVSAASGAFVHGDLPAPEQLDHRDLLPRHMGRNVAAVSHLLPLLPLDAGPEAADIKRSRPHRAGSFYLQPQYGIVFWSAKR